MALREIPATAVEVQTGLWADARTVSLGSLTRTSYNLYSAEGYCFYIPANNLHWETGEPLPENERTYYQFMYSAYQTIDEINANIVSVPVQDGYEIASGGNDHEIA